MKWRRTPTIYRLFTDKNSPVTTVTKQKKILKLGSKLMESQHDLVSVLNVG